MDSALIIVYTYTRERPGVSQAWLLIHLCAFRCFDLRNTKPSADLSPS